jgi:hypothetical protein
MGGLTNRLEDIKRRLGWPGLGAKERGELQAELGEGSRLLDHTEGWLK